MKYSTVFRPKFFHLFKKGRYSRERFVSDLIAGIIVGIIALPLAIAFGIASGVTPQQGLITAIVAGFIIAVFGGSRFLIGGPTGAFIVVISGIIAQYGMTGLTIATIMAGIMLIIMGFCRMGAVFKFIPYPIVVGFTSGIALTIFSTQMKDFFGMTDLDVPAGFIQEWVCYFSNLGSIDWVETALSAVCLLTIILWNKYVTKKVPGALIAIIVGTAASLLLSRFAGIEFATIGSKFPELGSGMSLPKPSMPDFDLNTIKDLVSPALTIAFLCAIESLLAAMVADGVTGKQHDSNTELIAQGMANIVTPLFGGIPSTGALARTMASINNGARTSVAGLVHSVVLLLIFLFLMPLAKYIPTACLAGVLVVVSYGMCGWRSFLMLMKNPKSDVTVLLITFFLTIIFDLTVAIEVGLIIACLLFMKRMAETTDVKVIMDEIDPNDETDIKLENNEHLIIPKGVEVYEINGPYFFGAGNKFEEVMAAFGDRPKVRIIRMRKVPFVDSTGIHNLTNLCAMSKKEGIEVVLSGVNPKVHAVLEHAGFYQLIGEQNICPHINIALAKAREIVGATD